MIQRTMFLPAPVPADEGRVNTYSSDSDCLTEMLWRVRVGRTPAEAGLCAMNAAPLEVKRRVPEQYVLDDWRVRWIYAPSVPYEDEVARRWWSLCLNCLLPLSDGRYYQLLFPGHPGGSTGPDVRDAVLALADKREIASKGPTQQLSSASKLFGDIEFHVRSSDWKIHRHHTDPRYNAVILHVVLICDDPYPTLREDGIPVPVCSLYDLVWPAASASHAFQTRFPSISNKEVFWPCQHVMSSLFTDERDKLLTRAGLLRFEQKTHNFIEQLHAITSDDAHDTYNAYDAYDACLIPALAEGLGYGRDREFFRAVGFRLLQKHAPLPEPLGHTSQPAPLDARRLSILALLLKRWRIPGVWQTLRACLLSMSHEEEQGNPDITSTILTALRQTFTESGLSLARTDILIVNIVLPFAAAVALLEHHPLLAQRASDLYISHPSLPSNSITRIMTRQLQLPKEPQGSCRQQGLHYIYQQTCREKRCNICMLGKNDV